MFKKMSLSLKLILGFLAVALITAAVGITGWVGISNTSGEINELGNTSIPTIIYLEVMKIEELNVKIVQRTLMSPYLTREEVQRQFDNLEAIRKRAEENTANYNKISRTEKEEQLWQDFRKKLAVSVKQTGEFLDKAKGLLNENVNNMELARELTRMGMSGDADAAFSNSMDALQKLIDYAKNYYGGTVVQEAQDLANTMNLIIIIATAAGLVFALGLGTILSRSISKPINNMSEDLGSTAGSMNSAASQVSSSAQELSSGASQLASSVEEMTSSMEELQSTIENNTKNIREAENIMDQTIKGTEDVTSRMEKMRSAMGEINQHSKQIEKIIKVIDDIAFQTNILALNAAVEAARAGDAGRGFVVVADQVKSLAQKSAEAAKETADLIEKAIRSINEGESTTDEVLNSQSNAKELAEKVSNLLDEVTKASQEQLKGANQVTQGISQINNVVQQTASSSEELASSGEEMLSQSEMMENIVFKLNELVQGEGKVERKQPQKKKTQRQSQPSGPQNTGGSGQKNPSSNGGPKKQPQKQKVDLVRPEDQIPLEDFEDF